MESIQLAQMLADISDLGAAQDAKAATALVQANKNLVKVMPPTDESTRRNESEDSAADRHHSRVASTISPAAPPKKSAPSGRFDMLGRIMTPPLSRTNSAQNSIPGTPRRDSDAEDDVDRANRLLTLYDIRAKLKQQDNTSLLKAREKVNAMIAKQQMQGQEGRRTPVTKYAFPKTT